MSKLNKEKLIIIVQKLLDDEGTFDDEQEQWKALQDNFGDWTKVLSDIYQTRFGDGYPFERTAKDIVDTGLAWKPIQLPEKLYRSE